MKRAFLRLLGFIVIIQLVYLVVTNVALNLPLTQAWLNRLKPDVYAVYWDRALTWYPMHIRASGVSANGQTASQQWQIDTVQASASLSILPLLGRTLQIRGMNARNVEIRVRPRLKHGNLKTARQEHHPRIRDRAPDQPAQPAMLAASSDWKIELDKLRVEGDHQVWIHHVRASLQGTLKTDLDYATGGGPLALQNGDANVGIKSFLINGESVVADGGTVSGQFDMTPFIPSEFPGREALHFLSADARLDLHVENLDFLDFYLGRFNAMDIDGDGTLRGRLNYRQGLLLEETQVEVNSSALVLKAPPYILRGRGRIDVAPDIADPGRVSMDIAFAALSAFRGTEQLPLFSGENLNISVSARNQMPAGVEQSVNTGRVDIRMPMLRVADLSAYQYLLPEKWQLRLRSGAGTLQGTAMVSATSTRANLRLQSGDADLEFRQHRFTSDLDLKILAEGDVADTASLNLAGTYLKFDNAQLINSARAVSPPWNTALLITEGTLRIPLSVEPADERNTDLLVRTLKTATLRDALSVMDADVRAELSVSKLSWLNLLFRSPSQLSLTGAGEVEADIKIRAGYIAQGTALSVAPQNLQIQVLDHAAQGQGKIVVAVVRGGRSPDLALKASLTRGSLTRRDKSGAVVEDVHLELAVRAEEVSLDESVTVTAIDVRIPSAHVKDISTYNQYLPPQLPLRLLGGEAQLSSDIHLTPTSASGSMIVQTHDFESRLGEQKLFGALTMDVNIADGVPAERLFDISGSSLRLHDFKVTGDQRLFDQPDWSARIDFEKAEIVWKNPVQIDVEAAVSLIDSRPFTALLANQRGKHGWIEKLLTVEHIQGRAVFQLSPEELRIPQALAGGDSMDIGVKALINERTREGMVLVRYGKLGGILKLKDGLRDFDVLGARKKFDGYVPGHTEVFPVSKAPYRSETPRR